MSSKLYKTVEIVSSHVSNELGDFTNQSVAERNTTIHAQRPRIGLITSQTKTCLANFVPGLAEATTIVHVPGTDPNGDKLGREEWNQAFWFACSEFGVPLWTQSSFKGLTFYFVTKDMFDKLASKWNLNEDGPRFAAYIGLLFSDMGGDRTFEFDVPTIVEPNDGQDGSCTVGQNVWGKKSCQIRGMVQDNDGIPVSIAKGIVVPIQGDGKTPALNTNQVKHGQGGKFTILTNGDEKLRKMWVSAELPVFLNDNAFVRNFLAQRVEAEVADYLSLLSEGGRVDLLKRLGGLTLDTNGELESAKRLVIEALRSKLPWCQEIEERITRFALKEIAESIVPSGAIRAWLSTLVISNEHGMAPCSWKDAKAFCFRIPVTGSNAIVPLPGDPYVKNKGMVVTAEIAKLVSGDDDYDQLAVVTDPEIVELFRQNLNHNVVTGLKPEKTKSKAAISVEFMEDLAIKQVENSWMVGALTIAGWKMVQEGDNKVASMFLDWANVEPMTYKHQICYNGIEFHEFVGAEYGKYRDDLKAVKLQWRDKAQESRDWKGPRDLAKAQISKPRSHLDVAWNSAVNAAQKWAAANPLKPLSLASIARLAFGESGIVIPGSAWREAREMISWWGQYWSENTGNKGDHSVAYQHAAEWGRNASREAKAAMLLWRPKNPENSGFNLKWHTGSVCCDVLGMNEDVAEAVKALRNKKQDLERMVALVEALLETIQ